MGNLGGRPGHFGGAGRQHRHRAGSAGGPGQHDRPSARQRAAAVGDRRDGDELGRGRRARCHSSPPTVRGARSASPASPAPQSRLIVSIDEARVTAAIDREIRTAYLQLAFVCLFVLLGALIAAEKLIIQPIELLAGDGQALRPGRLVGARRAQPAASRVRSAGPRLQRDGGPAQPARARTGRDQRPPDRDGLDRHAVGPRQPPRLPEPARFRMDEGAAIRQRAVAADDRCRSFQALQRHLWPSRRRRLPVPARRDDCPASPPTPWALPAAMAARSSACCCRTPTRLVRSRSARWCAPRC